MKKYELIKWTFANALGLGIGFVVSLQTLMLIQYGFDFEKHWQFVPPKLDLLTYFAYLVSALIGGAILGWSQSMVLKARGIKPFSWFFATVIGFGLIVLIDWPLLYTGDLGIIPGPVEPIIFTVGGGIFAGAMHYFLLRRLGFNAKKWFLMWIAGLVVGILPTGLFFTFIADPIGLSWQMDTFFSGFIPFGVAALISGKALFSVFSKKS